MNNSPLDSIELEKIEQLVFKGGYLEAGNYVQGILDLLVRDGGGKSILQLLCSVGDSGNLSELLTRLCSVIGQVVAHADFEARVPNLETLMVCQSTLSRIFALTPFISSDYLIQHLLEPDEHGIIQGSNILKAFLLFSTESKFTERLQTVRKESLDLYLATCLMLIWACTGSEQSCANREWAYGELNDFLDQNTTVQLPFGLIHGIFMHSSYGFSQRKHELKQRINHIIKKSLPIYNLEALNSTSLPSSPNLENKISKITEHKKPVLLVILEYFHPVHSIYRVLGRSLQACKEDFTLVAVAMPGKYVGELPKDFFDIQITLSGTGVNYCLDEVFGIADQYRPVAVYYPSIGMTPWTIYYSNIRLAPVQFTAVGHGASSFATEIDYFLIEEDIAGAADTYSEKLICLPTGSMPFLPPSGLQYLPRKFSKSSALKQEIIQIVCCATMMKLNSHLLLLCQSLDQKYRSQPNRKSIAFTFLLVTQAGELTNAYYKQLILRYLPNAVIHIDLPFQAYLDKLALMDIALSPFPYGNMNGLIDCATLGVIGVCMQGPQVHEAIDAGMMRRMGMPEWLIANNEEQYEATVCRLIDDDSERIAIREDLIQNKRYLDFFIGDGSIFANYVKQIVSGETVDHLLKGR